MAEQPMGQQQAGPIPSSPSQPPDLPDLLKTTKRTPKYWRAYPMSPAYYQPRDLMYMWRAFVAGRRPGDLPGAQAPGVLGHVAAPDQLRLPHALGEQVLGRLRQAPQVAHRERRAAPALLQ